VNDRNRLYSTVGVQNKPHVRVLLFELNYGWFILPQVLKTSNALSAAPSHPMGILALRLSSTFRHDSFRFSILSCDGNVMVWPILCQPHSHNVLTRPTTSDLFLTDQDRNKVEEERIKRTRSERNYLIPGNDVFDGKTRTFNSTERSKKSNAWYRTFWSQVNGTKRVKGPFYGTKCVKGPFYGTKRLENSMVWNVLKSQFNSNELSEQPI
jgi:hypothetical protein